MEGTPGRPKQARIERPNERSPFDWHRWLKDEFYLALKKRIRVDHADEDIDSFLHEVESMLDDNDAARENLAKKRKNIRNMEIPSTQRRNESDEKFQERKERAWQGKLRALATDFPPYVYILEKIFPEAGADASHGDAAIAMRTDTPSVMDAQGDDVVIPHTAADTNEASEEPVVEPRDPDPQPKDALPKDNRVNPLSSRVPEFASSHTAASAEKKPVKPRRFIPLWMLPFLAPFAAAAGMAWLQYKTIKGMWWASGKAYGEKGGGGHEKKEKKHEKKDDHGHGGGGGHGHH